MNAADIMTAPAISVDPDATVPQISALLLERRISAVPVVAGGRLVGIVSEADLLRRHEIGTDGESGSVAWWRRMFGTDESIREYIKSHALRAFDIMTREVVTVGPRASVAVV